LFPFATIETQPKQPTRSRWELSIHYAPDFVLIQSEQEFQVKHSSSTTTTIITPNFTHQDFTDFVGSQIKLGQSGGLIINHNQWSVLFYLNSKKISPLSANVINRIIKGR